MRAPSIAFQNKLRGAIFHLTVLLANLARFVFPPRLVYRVSGVMPFRMASKESYSSRTINKRSLFHASRPPGTLFGQESWEPPANTSLHPNHLIEVERGIASSQGRLFNRRGELIWQGVQKHPVSVKYRRQLKQGYYSQPLRSAPTIKQIQGDLAVVVASTQDFYFHWLYDVLPRVSLLEKEGFKDVPLYIAANTAFQQESLRLMGIGGKRIINCKQFPLISADRLVVVTHEVGPGQAFPDWTLAYLRSKFLIKKTTNRLPTPRRLFISRADAAHRRINNEKEITDWLKEYGFERVVSEHLSLQDQIALFQGAEVIMAPHGGGLANLGFCAPGTKVIEIFPGKFKDLYFRLSDALKLEYFYIAPENTLNWKNDIEEFSIPLQAIRDILSLADIHKGRK